MARPIKEGLDYFELDCQLEEKVRLIQAEFGLKGFAIVVKLYQKIYGGFGYYCEWNEDSLLLFMSENGVSSRDEKNLISEIVAACIRRNIFSEKLFNEFGILTSYGVQKRYLNAVSRREKVELIKEYLLISVGKNQCNVYINSINVNRNSVNVCSNSQSREEKSNKNHCESEPHDNESDREEQLLKDFEIIYALYPKKRGKTVAFANYKLWVGNGKDVGGKRYKLTNRQIYLAVKKYIRQQEEAGQDDYQYWKNFDTLMGRQLLDYVEVEDGKNS